MNKKPANDSNLITHDFSKNKDKGSNVVSEEEIATYLEESIEKLDLQGAILISYTKANEMYFQSFGLDHEEKLRGLNLSIYSVMKKALASPEDYDEAS